jgi:DNA invertase Pin-like site-specific DNA recombinase
MRAVAYIRVSTDRQDLGPEAQRSAIAAWSARVGTPVEAWHEDRDVSGAAALEDCPGLFAALGELGRGDVLVVAKRDRLARDSVKAALLERDVEARGAAIVSADGVGEVPGPEGQLLRRILDAFAEYERAVIRARIKAALGAKKRRGEPMGQAPYGYRYVNGKLEAHELEQQAAARAAQLARAGHTYFEIARTLNVDGHVARGRKGKLGRWSPSSVCRLLKGGRRA